MTKQTFDRNLAPYLRKIYDFPLITSEEETRLAERWQQHQDIEAAHRLVESHLRLVVKIARGYRGYGLPISDLISEGSVGMMQAVRRFDHKRGYRLSTYAIWWVHAAMQEYVLRSWSLVKIGTTAAQKKLFFNLGRLKRQLQAMSDGDLSPENVKTIAAELGIAEDEIVSMNRRLAAPDESLNELTGDNGFGHVTEWQDLLVDETVNQESAMAERTELCYRRRLVRTALDGLTSRERDIIKERRLKERRSTLGDLGKRYGLSRESIRLIEGRALEKLRQAVGAQM